MLNQDIFWLPQSSVSFLPVKDSYCKELLFWFWSSLFCLTKPVTGCAGKFSTIFSLPLPFILTDWTSLSTRELFFLSWRSLARFFFFLPAPPEILLHTKESVSSSWWEVWAMQEVKRIRRKRTRRPKNGAMNMDGELILILYMVNIDNIRAIVWLQITTVPHKC